MLKREWGAESIGNLPHLFIPSKTTTLVPEFAAEDLSLGRTAAMVPGITVKYLPLGSILIYCVSSVYNLFNYLLVSLKL